MISKSKKRVRPLLKYIRNIVGILAASLGIYGLISDLNEIYPFFCFGTFLLINGFYDLHERRKIRGFIFILTSAFIFFVLIHKLIN